MKPSLRAALFMRSESEAICMGENECRRTEFAFERRQIASLLQRYGNAARNDGSGWAALL